LFFGGILLQIETKNKSVIDLLKSMLLINYAVMKKCQSLVFAHQHRDAGHRLPPFCPILLFFFIASQLHTATLAQTFFTL
jgi:hypothetical protein